MTHYATIGVSPDASPAEIKRTFRQKAARLHPDKKSGDADAMVKLNLAYRVLSDPDKRQRYDQTGEDTERPLDAHARGLVMRAFSDALQQDVPDVLTHARKFLEQTRRNIQSECDKAATAAAKFRKRRSKIKSKDKDNLFHVLIDQQLKQIEVATAKFYSDLEVCELALGLLGGYNSTEKPEPVPMIIFSGFSAITT